MFALWKAVLKGLNVIIVPDSMCVCVCVLYLLVCVYVVFVFVSVHVCMFGYVCVTESVYS